MKVFITGGTGFVGTHLMQQLTGQGYLVTLLTRSIRPGRTLPSRAVYLEGDPTNPGPWQDEVASHEIIVNLAGASIFSRWTESYKKAIYDSRIRTTRNVVAALAPRKGQETVLLNASAVGYYGFHEDQELDEETPPGNDFLAVLARDWENEAKKASEFGVRVVLCRFGIVMGEKGGALDQMVPIFKKGLGAPLGSGEQWFSWIHQQDLSAALLFLIDRKEFSGPVNCTSPYPVRNRELTKILGEVLGKPTFMPAVPGFMLRIIIGEFGNVLLKGQRVLPKKLLTLGYSFRFPLLKEALSDLLKKTVI
ncbi:MAG: TIGR01777 family protein [Deltaproteobacteria bacterium]|nr:TIGR01777 family protein [Deltaproteobacteria bacterium]